MKKADCGGCHVCKRLLVKRRGLAEHLGTTWALQLATLPPTLSTPGLCPGSPAPAQPGGLRPGPVHEEGHGLKQSSVPASCRERDVLPAAQDSPEPAEGRPRGARAAGLPLSIGHLRCHRVPLSVIFRYPRLHQAWPRGKFFICLS